MVVTPEPVAMIVAAEFHRPIVMPARRVFTPGVIRTDGVNRQEGLRPLVSIGAPPQALWQESPFWGPTVALALVGDDSTASQSNRDRLLTGSEPPPARITSGGKHPQRRKWLSAPQFSISI